MAQYYFRVDGGDIYSIATGHIMRCLKFADFISSREEAEISFIMRSHTGGVGLVKRRYNVIQIDAGADVSHELEVIKKTVAENSYFICDLRNVNNTYIDDIKGTCLRFVLFDDLGIKNVRPNLLINPTPFCYDSYDRDVYPNTTLLLGEKYFFIGPGLVDKAYVRDFKKQRYNIMASFGGADPCNITEFFISNIVPKLGEHNISVILGPAYREKDAIIERYNNIPNLRFYTDIIPLDDVFLSNDIAFVCGGDSCIESCASGAATFIISSIYYEKEIGELLHKKKKAWFVTDIDDIRNDNVDLDFLEVVRNDPDRLSSLSENGRNLVDGRGAARVYEYLHN